MTLVFQLVPLQTDGKRVEEGEQTEARHRLCPFSVGPLKLMFTMIGMGLNTLNSYSV